MDGGGGRLPVDGNCGRPPADGAAVRLRRTALGVGPGGRPPRRTSVGSSDASGRLADAAVDVRTPDNLVRNEFRNPARTHRWTAQITSRHGQGMLALFAPSNGKEIRGFLGCVGYYRRFIEGYAKRAIPLTELLKKDTEFEWTGNRQKAFEDLKIQLATAPILSSPDWTKDFHVTIDASGWCLGSILWQYDTERRESPFTTPVDK
jgi:hypothetical protein